MEVKNGLYKTVLIFNNIVIKLPRNLEGALAILSEQYGYFIVGKAHRHMLLKIYFAPFVPILF